MCWYDGIAYYSIVIPKTYIIIDQRQWIWNYSDVEYVKINL